MALPLKKEQNKSPRKIITIPTLAMYDAGLNAKHSGGQFFVNSTPAMGEDIKAIGRFLANFLTKFLTTFLAKSFDQFFN